MDELGSRKAGRAGKHLRQGNCWGGNSRQAEHSLRGSRQKPKVGLVWGFLRWGSSNSLSQSAPHMNQDYLSWTPASPSSAPQPPNLCSARSSQVWGYCPLPHQKSLSSYHFVLPTSPTYPLLSVIPYQNWHF